jgi:hypothetical protein
MPSFAAAIRAASAPPHLILPSGELEKLIREPKLSLLQKAKQAGLKALGPASTPQAFLVI